MTQDLTAYWIANVTPEYAHDANRFHTRVAQSNPHIWPRTEDEVHQLIEDGCLFAVWMEDELVALCYAALDESKGVWEIGGLTVDPSVQRKGIGSVLVRFALAHTFVYDQPWSNNQKVVAHVHEANENPRTILERVGFQYCRQIEVPANQAPPTMERNSEGKIIGDEFEFTLEGLKDLAEWFKQDFDKLHVQFRLDMADVNHLRTALNELAGQYS